MPKNTHLNRAKKAAYDEYYTTKEHVEYIFNKYIPKDCLKGKIVYSFCDSEQSEFVKYIKSHKEELQYKEYIYTWDDYNNHYDLFEKCDIIITNPPFSKLIKEIIPILNRCKKEFFILCSWSSVHNYYRIFEGNVRFIRPELRKAGKMYVCADKNIKPDICTLYITNIKEVPDYYKSPKFNGKGDYVLCKIDDTEVVRNYDKINDVPLDYYEPVLVPLTVLFEHNRKYFDMLEKQPKRCEYFDNRERYVRFLAQRKK